MKSWIPNMLTISNLVFGIFSLIASFNGQFFYAALLIIVAMVADGLDGRAARYFQVSSEFGRELDSLCDLASFGVAPAFLAYVYSLQDFGYCGAGVAALFAACGAFRLARFNVNTNEVKGYFMGLPIPAGGCLVATFVWLGVKPVGFAFPIMLAVIAYLMVSCVKYPDFKGKGETVQLGAAIIAVMVSGYVLYLLPSVKSLVFVGFFAYALLGIVNTLFGVIFSQQQVDS